MPERFEMTVGLLAHLDEWCRRYAPIAAEDADATRDAIARYLETQTDDDVNYLLAQGWSKVHAIACAR